MPSVNMPAFALANQTFKSKTAAMAHIKNMLNNASKRVPFSGDDHRLLLSLLCRYPDYKAEPTYYHCSSIVVDIHPEYRNRCFFARTDDGAALPWSYRKAFTPPTWRRRISAACRSIIEPQIHDFREKSTRQDGRIRCEITGDICSDADIAIDHNYDDESLWFSSLVSQWLAEAKVPPRPPINNIKLTRRIEFVDTKLNESWFNFHAERADLRTIKRTLNQSANHSPTPSPPTSDTEDSKKHDDADLIKDFAASCRVADD